MLTLQVSDLWHCSIPSRILERMSRKTPGGFGVGGNAVQVVLHARTHGLSNSCSEPFSCIIPHYDPQHGHREYPYISCQEPRPRAAELSLIPGNNVQKVGEDLLKDYVTVGSEGLRRLGIQGTIDQDSSSLLHSPSAYSQASSPSISSPKASIYLMQSFHNRRQPSVQGLFTLVISLF